MAFEAFLEKNSAVVCAMQIRHINIFERAFKAFDKFSTFGNASQG